MPVDAGAAVSGTGGADGEDLSAELEGVLVKGLALANGPILLGAVSIGGAGVCARESESGLSAAGSAGAGGSTGLLLSLPFDNSLFLEFSATFGDSLAFDFAGVAGSGVA